MGGVSVIMTKPLLFPRNFIKQLLSETPSIRDLGLMVAALELPYGLKSGKIAT